MCNVDKIIPTSCFLKMGVIMGAACGCGSGDGTADGLVFKTPHNRSNTDPKQNDSDGEHLIPVPHSPPNVYGSLTLTPSSANSDKIEVTSDIMIDYILALTADQLLESWKMIDVNNKNSITAHEQFRTLLVLLVDQYIDSQLCSATRLNHIVTTSLTLMRVDHSRGNTVSSLKSEDHQTAKPSVIFDCNEMVELEEMMGDMVKHARSAPVVDYLLDQFHLKLTAHGHGSKPYITKPFYLMHFQKYFKEIRDGKGPRSESTEF